MTPLESLEVMLQVVVSPLIVILMTLDVLFILLEKIYNTEAVFLVMCDLPMNEL
jgi:hypothetical protein